MPDGYRFRKTPNLHNASTQQLVKTLEHPNAWHRETASRLLFERQDENAVQPLGDLARQSASPLGRLHAMYALAGILMNRIRSVRSDGTARPLSAKPWSTVVGPM